MLETLVILDIGADRNIIHEGLIPIRYYEKPTQALSTTHDQKLKIKYKLFNAIVCIKKVSMYMSFILIQDTSTKVILGYPYTALIEPFTIDDGRIHINLRGKNMTFKLEFYKRKTLISSLKKIFYENSSY